MSGKTRQQYFLAPNDEKERLVADSNDNCSHTAITPIIVGNRDTKKKRRVMKESRMGRVSRESLVFIMGVLICLFSVIAWEHYIEGQTPIFVQRLLGMYIPVACFWCLAWLFYAFLALAGAISSPNDRALHDQALPATPHKNKRESCYFRPSIWEWSSVKDCEWNSCIDPFESGESDVSEDDNYNNINIFNDDINQNNENENLIVNKRINSSTGGVQEAKTDGDEIKKGYENELGDIYSYGRDLPVNGDFYDGRRILKKDRKRLNRTLHRWIVENKNENFWREAKNVDRINLKVYSGDLATYPEEIALTNCSNRPLRAVKVVHKFPGVKVLELQKFYADQLTWHEKSLKYVMEIEEFEDGIYLHESQAEPQPPTKGRRSNTLQVMYHNKETNTYTQISVSVKLQDYYEPTPDNPNNTIRMKTRHLPGQNAEQIREHQEKFIKGGSYVDIPFLENFAQIFPDPEDPDNSCILQFVTHADFATGRFLSAAATALGAIEDVSAKAQQQLWDLVYKHKATVQELV